MMDVVNREEFEAVRDMAVAARNANDALERRIAELEAKLAATTPERVIFFEPGAKSASKYWFDFY